MSAFLGPIHTWLYKKIEFQNELVNQIVVLADRKGWLNDSIQVDQYGTLETGALEDIVDESNIHGWLQEKVSLVENKLAYLVTALTKYDASRMQEISDIAYQLGEAHGFKGETIPKAVYQHLDALLLNGMPCDHVNNVIKEDENTVVWQQMTDIHEQYWNAVHGNPEHYDVIRESLIAGLLAESGVDYRETDDRIYELRKVD